MIVETEVRYACVECSVNTKVDTEAMTVDVAVKSGVAEISADVSDGCDVITNADVDSDDT